MWGIHLQFAVHDNKDIQNYWNPQSFKVFSLKLWVINHVLLINITGKNQIWWDLSVSFLVYKSRLMVSCKPMGTGHINMQDTIIKISFIHSFYLSDISDANLAGLLSSLWLKQSGLPAISNVMLTEKSLCLSKRHTIYNSRKGKFRQAPY